MESELGTAPLTDVAALEHLTGPSRGTVTWLNASTSDISLSPERFIRVSEAHPGEARDDLVARLHRAEDTYEIEAPEGRSGMGERRSHHRPYGSSIATLSSSAKPGRCRAFACTAKTSRFASRSRDILGDGIDYLRVSRQPFASRVFRAFCELLRRLTRETTILFRITVTVAILALAALAYQQARLNTRPPAANRNRRCPARQLRRGVGPRQRRGADSERPDGAASGTRAAGCLRMRNVWRRWSDAPGPARG